jgi:hypothetical protein
MEIQVVTVAGFELGFNPKWYTIVNGGSDAIQFLPSHIISNTVINFIKVEYDCLKNMYVMDKTKVTFGFCVPGLL